MTQTPDIPPDIPAIPARTPEQDAKADRALRLASALRDNLRRRKVAAPVRVKPRN